MINLVQTTEQEDEGHNDPGKIETDIVYPIIEEFRSTVGDARELVIEIVGVVIECYAVEMGGADDGLEEVASEPGFDDGEEGEPAEGAPDELKGM